MRQHSASGDCLFFSFREALKHNAFRAKSVIDDDIHEAHRVVHSLFLGERESPEKSAFEWAQGRWKYDVVGTTWGGMATLVSDRVVSVLREQALTGWRTYPISLTGRDGREIGGYQGLSVVGRCGPLDESRPRIEKCVGLDGLPYETRVGIYFDIESWDGSDVFCPAGTVYKLLTKRAAEILIAANLTNASIQATTDISLVAGSRVPRTTR